MVSGDDDGSLHWDENDCDLLFDIELTTSSHEDTDPFTAWEEANHYFSDPTVDDSSADWDNDGIPNGYEKKHGLIPDEDDALGDLDGDLIPNLWEYQLKSRGKSPDNPYDTRAFNIVVSMNWDADANEIANFEEGMRRVSSLLFEATDGFFLIGSCEIYTNSVNGDVADILIFQGDKVGYPAGDWKYWPFTSTIGRRAVNMPEKYVGYTNNENNDFRYGPLDYEYVFALTHELCHLKFQLWDEYYTVSLYLIDENYRVKSIMSSLYGYRELSTLYSYGEAYTKIRQDNMPEFLLATQQLVLGGGPCWQRVYSDNNYFTGTAVEKGVQFDLDNDGIIDVDFYDNYRADSFNQSYDWWFFTISYDVGDFMAIS